MDKTITTCIIPDVEITYALHIGPFNEMDS